MDSRLSFDVTREGLVTQVYFTPDENQSVLTLKKILLGTLSTKLVISHENLKNGSRWAYRVNETGHEGNIHVCLYMYIHMYEYCKQQTTSLTYL